MNLEIIREFVKEKHTNQKRKHGTPYYTHPFAVAEKLKQKGFDENYQAVGLMHDLLEDTDATESEILQISSPELLKATILLTKMSGYDKSEYIERISKNDIAKNVKLADRIHNLEESIYVDKSFRTRYLKETYEWYIPLSKNTVFENDLKNIVKKIEDSI